MEPRMTPALLLLLSTALLAEVKSSVAYDLKMDEALLTIHNLLPQDIIVYYVSDYCYKCLYQPLITLGPKTGNHSSNASVAIRTRFTLTLRVIRETGNTSLCSWDQLYGEAGHYSTWVQEESGSVTCTQSIDKAPINSYIPLLVGAVVLGALALLYVLGSYLHRQPCTQKYINLFCCKNVQHSVNCDTTTNDNGANHTKAKSSRLKSLDTFRGFSLTLMVFVNYGGGGYWFFGHAPWNGLTIADFVMPWFVFIIGTSVALAFSSMLRRGVSRTQLLRKLTWRTVVLFLIGVFFMNYGPRDGPLSWSWARIPGVLQRLGFTYFVLALMETCCAKKDISGNEGRWWNPVKDIVLYWPEWLFIILLEILWLSFTFLMPVPNCPAGYVGPGGIGEEGQFPNCTGGAAGYIDRWLLGENHVYSNPTCKELYRTTVPFDPEGVLGTANSIVMGFLGMQAGKILLFYRKRTGSILKRFLLWALLLGILSAILSKCTRDEGFIPVNKNLWSLSYITCMGWSSFILLGAMYFIIDVKGWWGGQPFIFPGMNSIFVYVGHSLLGTYFPFNWDLQFQESHAAQLFQDLLGTALWVLIAYFLYRHKFFLKI
ncbi:heparan-alpha-glucosaminide N-acetyltransferase isoform X2 [Amia ocellicauda]|uniref:heparan-alpha-glucosaminide N-acetyltransferase isoform X2 n=1 Tax=Amia ocellicauda TaxID=2972642 RepID=UPI00346444A5